MYILKHTEFQKLWRSVPVDSIDDEKIEEYLKKQGISSMQETGPKKVVSISSTQYILFLMYKLWQLHIYLSTSWIIAKTNYTCAFCSYMFKRRRSKVGRGRDNSSTTTIWPECWRIIQMVFLGKNEFPDHGAEYVQHSR